MSHDLNALAEQAKNSKGPPTSIRPLTDRDVLGDPKKALNFARAHLTNCIAGMKLCQAQAWLHSERDTYADFQRQLEDMLERDLKGVEGQIEETV